MTTTMIHKFIMPKLGWTMTHGKVVKWHATEGDTVEKGQEILEIETDKVTIKVEAPETGTLIKILHGEGESVPVNYVLALIVDDPGSLDEGELDETVKSITANEGKTAQGKTGESIATAGSGRAGKGIAPSSHVKGRVPASPKARKLAREHDIDLSKVPGSGPGSAVLFDDVEAHIASRAAIGHVERVPHDGRLTITSEIEASGIRKVIAERMHGSLLNSAQLTITTEVNVNGVAAFRNAVNAEHISMGKKKVSYTDIIALVVASVLERFPKFNGSFDGTILRQFKEINLGIAVATERGLLVPVVWNANTYSLDGISKRIKTIAGATRKGTIAPDDLSGSTFTITNLGMFGVDAFTPIINPPELAILGVGRIVTKPAFEGGGIQPMQSMVLSLSFDHQVIDGHEAAIFLNDIKQSLESREKIEQLHERKHLRSLHRAQVNSSNGSADYDVVVIGAGPAGNDAVLKLASKGYRCAIIENKVLGGTCLNHGCVPLKNLFFIADAMRKMKTRIGRKSGFSGKMPELDYNGAVSRKNEVCMNMQNAMQSQYESAMIDVFKGTASFTGDHSIVIQGAGASEIEGKEISFKKAIITTGATYPPIHASDGTRVPDVIDFLDRAILPDSIAIIGEGKEALELASCLYILGVEEVSVVCENIKDLLYPFDEDILNAMVDTFELDGIDIISGARVSEITRGDGGGYSLTLDITGKKETIHAMLVVNASHRMPNTRQLNLERAGIDVNEDGTIRITSNFHTTNPRVLAAGDVVNLTNKRLTYLASRQGRVVADALAGARTTVVDDAHVPRGYFTIPPAASVGMSARTCQKRGITHENIYFPFSRLVNAHLVHGVDGMMKITIDKNQHEILGVQIFGELAHELISTATIAIKQGMRIQELVDILQLHPAFSESFKDAGFTWSLTKRDIN
ncbi:hypothetical protein GF325_07510 [Candidatus Bathyarchaeota archaeon]|nr:hypothetical protein [Candidatus Bathyarchaeota archaeon]